MQRKVKDYPGAVATGPATQRVVRARTAFAASRLWNTATFNADFYREIGVFLYFFG